MNLNVFTGEMQEMLTKTWSLWVKQDLKFNEWLTRFIGTQKTPLQL